MASQTGAERPGPARRLRARPSKRTLPLLAAFVVGATAAITALVWLFQALRGSEHAGAIVPAGVAALALAFIWYMPKRQLNSVREHLGPDYPKVENDVRGTWAQIIGGVVLLTSLGFTWFQTNDTRLATQRSLEITEQGQNTDRFAGAIQQLGDDRLELRLGGIYSLEQIAIDAPESHYWPVMQVLTAFVRERTPIAGSETSPASPTAGSTSPPRSDVQAILTVLGRRDARWDAGSLDLSYTNLSGADLSGARLENANLTGTHLEDADLTRAALENADLTGAVLVDAHLNEAKLGGAELVGANLEGATLTKADLTEAGLTGAHLDGAILNEANLSGAFLTGASLTGASLNGAHLDETDLGMAVGLTQEQVDEAIVGPTTLLPPDVQPPADSETGEGA